VVDDVGPGHQLVERRPDEVAEVEVKVLFVTKGGEIELFERAGVVTGVRVDPVDDIAVSEESLAEVGADEACRARD